MTAARPSPERVDRVLESTGSHARTKPGEVQPRPWLREPSLMRCSRDEQGRWAWPRRAALMGV